MHSQQPTRVELNTRRSARRSTQHMSQGRLRPVNIPIEDLLGADGHRHCSGYRLLPVNGSISEAKKARKDWAEAQQTGNPLGSPPLVEQIKSFEGGTVKFVFGPAKAGSGWEVSTMFVEPKKV